MTTTAKAARPPTGRQQMLVSALVLTVTWPIGLALFVVWAVISALSILTVVLPLIWPLSQAIRWYALPHQFWAARVLGLPAPDSRDRAANGTLPPKSFAAHTKSALLSPATWRRWAWLLVNCVTGFALSLIPLALLLGTAFYLCYPLLYATTPQAVFGTVFGVYELHSVSDAWIVTPMALVSFGLWWWLAPICTRANARVIIAMTAPSTATPSTATPGEAGAAR